MKNLTVEKSSVLAAYKAGSADQKEMLEHLFGKEPFAFDWREITSYEKACEVLGIQARALWPRTSGQTGTSRQPRKGSPSFLQMISKSFLA